MFKNVTIIIGSPNLKFGNSESIGEYLINKLNEKNLNCSKIYLRDEIKKEAKLVEHINTSDMLMLILPIYENSVPGLVIEFFEAIYKNKNQLIDKARKMFVITNSGFAEVEAHQGALNSCKLFSRVMNFSWMGGIAVAPGTLIGGKKLEQTGNIYKNLITALDILSEAILKDQEVPDKVFKLMSKSFIFPLLYRLGGKLAQRSVIKKIGKEAYFHKPHFAKD